MAYKLRDAFDRQTQVGLMLRIGSDPANEIVLLDPQVAPFHATLGEQPDGLLIRDEKSKSGTFVNQKRIKGLVNLKTGDQIIIGGTTFFVDNLPELQAVPTPPVQTPQQPVTPVIQPAQPTVTQVSPQPVVPTPTTGKKSGGCGKWVLTGILAAMLACVIFIGAGYFLYTSGVVTQKMIYTWLGMGPAEIRINNFHDAHVFVSVKEVPEEAKTFVVPSIAWDLAPFDTQADNNFTGTGLKYTAYFGTNKDGSELGICTFTPKSGDKYSFVILPDKILVDKVDFPEFMDKAPASGNDLVMDTSSLCR